MDNTEMFHHKNIVAAEYVGFRFEADLFQSVPMIISFCCHGQHWDVPNSENGCCRNRWFQIRSRPFQISTDNHRRWLSWTTLRRFIIRNGCCRNRWFRIRSKPLQMSAGEHSFWLSWTTLRCFTTRKWRNRRFQIRSRPLEISTDCFRFCRRGQHWIVSP